jgi:uncharacterized membrane protein (Fun14 family)
MGAQKVLCLAAITAAQAVRAGTLAPEALVGLVLVVTAMLVQAAVVEVDLQAMEAAELTPQVVAVSVCLAKVLVGREAFPAVVLRLLELRVAGVVPAAILDKTDLT